jgi:Protein of unknown function (DUF2842)
MKSRTRKALGCAVLLAYLGLYTGLAASLGAALSPSLPGWADLLFYALAGAVWIAPLRPLFAWMNQGG